MALQIKKFQAATLQEAIEDIRRELGDDAIILQTESIRGSGTLFGKNKVEVTAAIDREEAPPRFHATVGEDAAERGVSREKPVPGILNMLKGAKIKPSEKKAAAPSPRPTVKKPSLPSQSPAVSQNREEGSASAASSQPSLGQIYAMRTFVEPLRDEIEGLKKKMNQGDQRRMPSLVNDPLEEELKKLRAELRSFVNEKKFEGSDLPSYFKGLTQFWIEKGVSQKEVSRFFETLKEWGHHFSSSTPSIDAASQVISHLEGAIQEADVLAKRDPRIVVLIGPTGVGKTTTIAKMAAYEKLRLKKSVAFITMDDFKIGGTDQLNHYARILEVPFLKSRSDMSIEEQCLSLKADTIYIDTYGISPRDSQRIKALSKLLRFSDPILSKRVEIHLVLPVSIQPQDIRDQMQAFSPLGAQYLAFTKWDETDHWGGMLAAILTSKKPVSFISHGQNVPDDFALFSKKSFIETVTTFDQVGGEGHE
jgi:flagellar biosynthesis protein FlhF